MTQEEKQLLLQDLCARLPYSTLCYCKWAKDAPNGTTGCIEEISTYLLEDLIMIDDPNYECQICEIIPYLRPISSMTEEEKKEENKWWNIITRTRNNLHYMYTDWLLSHHFDYRGLIEKGLALEAPENMYNLKTI